MVAHLLGHEGEGPGQERRVHAQRRRGRGRHGHGRGLGGKALEHGQHAVVLPVDLRARHVVVLAALERVVPGGLHLAHHLSRARHHGGDRELRPVLALGLHLDVLAAHPDHGQPPLRDGDHGRRRVRRRTVLGRLGLAAPQRLRIQAALLDAVRPGVHGQQEVERLLARHLRRASRQDQLPSQEVRPAGLLRPEPDGEPSGEPAVLAELQQRQRARGADGTGERVVPALGQAQRGPHLGHQPRHVEGLAQEVVRPALQGLHDVVVGVHAGEEQEGNVLQLGRVLDLAEEHPAVHERHEDVAQDEVRGGHVPEPGQGVAGVAEAQHLEALVAQRGLDHAEDVGVVVDHHDALARAHG